MKSIQPLKTIAAKMATPKPSLVVAVGLSLAFWPTQLLAVVANENGTHHLALALGHHDLIDPSPKTGLVAVEYRPCCRLKTLRPAIGSFIDLQGACYSYVGIRSELESERRPFLFSVNTAVGYYRQGGGTRLGHPLEFRSGFEWYYVLPEHHQLGIAFHHLSNASIGKRNPGTEVLSLVFAPAFGRGR